MENYTIEVSNVGKTYKLYKKHTDRLKETLNPFNLKYHKEFNALSNVNLKIKKGETLGIIGKNGSGKSTLLKIITGVLSPTTGTINVKGRISALLELGAGFNGEMTGIENIYLNGTMLGYTKENIDNTIHSILQFADIGEFVYQPVKTYSSGMFVRLAFAVAINIDPDILIIDEALSVGDMKFQQKCYRKIRDFKKNGTVIFVSHDTGAIANFCDRVIWLNDGKVYKEGKPSEILDEYQAFMSYDIDEMDTQVSYTQDSGESAVESTKAKAFGNKKASFMEINLLNETNEASYTVFSGRTVKIKFKIDIKETIDMPILGFTMKDRLGIPMLITNTYFEKIELPSFEKNSIVEYEWIFDLPNFRSGRYSFDIALANGSYYAHEQVQWINDALVISIKNENTHQEGRGLIVLEGIHLLKK